MDNLDAIFISHLHADHVSGLFQLIQNMQIRRRTKALKIIMPKEGHQAFSQSLDAIYLSDKVILFKLDLIPPKSATALSHAKSCFARTHHLDDLAHISGNAGEANSCVLKYIIDNSLCRIVYSGDMQTADELMPMLGEPTSLLIVEMAHFSPEALFEAIAASAHQSEHVMITHLGPHWSSNDNEIQNQALKYLNKKVIISYDGLELVI